ncbi:MAG: hypothetical protein HY721_09030, partial [Planctomycetes bacterium]|nr:hypothetical protein [Planctomycetota bacterium]
IRPQLELSAIYVRRVDLDGPGEAAWKISPEGLGINVEPTIAISPSGDAAYCVWVHRVHDPDQPGLIESNRGRRLLYSIYSKGTNSWSAPESVLANLDDYDSLYPGVLEPSIALRDEMNGLLAFTAVAAGSPETDTGLGLGRLVYICRLVDGVFLEPVLIHGKCRLVYGYRPEVDLTIPSEVLEDPCAASLRGIEGFVAFESRGLEQGCGDIMIATLPEGAEEPSDASSDFLPADPEDCESNVSVGFGGCELGIGYWSAPGGLGGGRGKGGAHGFQTRRIRLEPDLSVEGCTLSYPFAAPGSVVTAKVEVKNRGLARAPVDGNGASTAGLLFIYADEGGGEREAARRGLPVLLPGEVQVVEVQLEMPHEPVRLRVQIDPNPVDRDRTNDSRQCFFGAPCPRDLTCRVAQRRGPAARVGVELSWTNPALYEELYLYRDGAMFVALPGSFTSFTDFGASPGLHTYSVRARIDSSRSVRATCEIDVPPPSPPSPQFRRADVDGNGGLEITDAIRLLCFLFLGCHAPPCPDAADADDNGELEITDAIRILGFLFLGAPPPRAPFPACGVDLTDDGLVCQTQPRCRP